MANLPLTADTTCSAEGPFCEGLLWVAARRNRPKSPQSSQTQACIVAALSGMVLNSAIRCAPQIALVSANPLLRVKPTNFGLTKIKPKVARLRLRHQENFVSMLGESSQVLFPCSVIANKIMGLRTKKTQTPWHDRAFFFGGARQNAYGTPLTHRFTHSADAFGILTT